MQKGTLMWIILVCAGFVAAIVTGLLYAFVSRGTKERLRRFEAGREPGEEIPYSRWPIVAINERFDFEKNYMSVAICLFLAWAVFVFGGPLNLASAETLKDTSFWPTFAVLIASLIMHVIAWIVFSAISFGLSAMRVFALKKRYEARQARVYDRTSLVFIIENQKDRFNKRHKNIK